ncbi:MAG TPA: tetratricopeptide repeat protein [Bryobacteraceae bacterium]|nr:tetratricopeptide repeat protein [Bryobacteraceae bacterium]
MCVVAAGLATIACGKKSIPALPKIATSAFPPQVRAQVDSAIRDAVMNPEDAGATGHLAMVLHAYQQFEPAEQCYRRARIIDPKTFEWAYYLTVIEQLRGETRQAIEDAQAAVGLDSSSKPARMRLADALLQGGRIDESRKIYEALVKEEPDRAIFHYGLGRALAIRGTTILDAVEQYKRTCQLAPAFGAAHLELSKGYSQIGDPVSAAREMAEYQKNPAGAPPEDSLMAQVTALNPGGLMKARTAHEYLADGKPSEAVRQLEATLAANPNDEAAQTDLVLAYWQLKQFDKAQDHYQAALKLNPATPANDIYGLAMLSQSRYSEAGSAFQRALTVNPKDPLANAQMGWILQMQGDLDGAIRSYTVALAADASSRSANYLMGVALLKQDQPKQAIEYLLKTIEPVDAKTPGYLRQLSDAYQKAGDEDHAHHYGQMAAPNGPTPPAKGTASGPDPTSPASLAGQLDIPGRS